MISRAAYQQQLIAVERGWRDFTGAPRLRPVFHYREDRIRTHSLLCWLAAAHPRRRDNRRSPHL